MRWPQKYIRVHAKWILHVIHISNAWYTHGLAYHHVLYKQLVLCLAQDHYPGI